MEFLHSGFKNGFSLCYQGPLRKEKRFSPNLKLRVGSHIELWNKVMKEVQAGRYAGPFDYPPFEHFVQSPIGLVSKDKGTKTRLIFHLSYPKNGDSVNSGIPKEFCSVKYPDFKEAIKLCINEGVGCSISKSDMSSAFRHVPMAKSQWSLLSMKAKHPVTQKLWYFIDKCLPFGSSISCTIFQAISDTIAFIVEKRAKKPNVIFWMIICLQQQSNIYVISRLSISCRCVRKFNSWWHLKKHFGAKHFWFSWACFWTWKGRLCVFHKRKLPKLYS